MKKCNHKKNYVINSRSNEFGVWRRRECLSCEYRWTTQEITIDNPRDITDPWRDYRNQVKRKLLKKISDELHVRASNI